LSGGFIVVVDNDRLKGLSMNTRMADTTMADTTMADTRITFTLNGRSRTITTDPDRPLLEVLREDLELTGTKYGCGEGECRACTVLMNGESTPSCLTSIGSVDGQTVLTVEGLAHGDKLHPVQQAFLAEGAFQCGYCTSGMIMGIASVMKRNAAAGEAEYRDELQKHICRCGGYPKYLSVVRRLTEAARTKKARV
jgi:aerobic-type carbon monoxide dehydrogenase small subunit (CoxS/CutS family)